MRFCVDFKVYINDKVMDEWGLRYARHRNDLPQPTWASYFGRIDQPGTISSAFFYFFVFLLRDVGFAKMQQ